MNDQITVKPALLDLQTVSKRTQLSKSSLYRLIKAGHLKSVKIGRVMRISEQELTRFITALENGEATI